MRWLHKDWWAYLLAPRKWPHENWLTVILCRARGHPEGMWWYNVGGTEPDMHCKCCGDDIG